MLFLTIIYFSTGLPAEADRFLVFSLIALIVSVTAEGMGLFIGSVFSVTVSIYRLQFQLFKRAFSMTCN